jgi:hypothetical protein
MISRLYRKLFTEPFRIFIYNMFLGRILDFFRNFNINAKSKFVFLFNWILPKTDENKAYAFMGRYGITSYPYKYMLEYNGKEISVEIDSVLTLPYVTHNNKKLYFPIKYTNKKIQQDYRSLIIEQDEKAAHRYVKSYDELKGMTLLDIGSAEGIFALDTIELVEHVYLFECENLWLTPLKATFAPWKEKVTFIEKYVSDVKNETNITIDDFLKNKPKDKLFLKMDIEGSEIAALNGARNTLELGKNIHLAICTYHRKGDPEKISSYMSALGYSYEFTDGLMYWNKRLSKGLIRCHKQI